MSWRWIRFCFLVDGLVMWRHANGSSEARAVYLVRQSENITVPCWNTWFSRYKDAHYTWLDHLDRGAARNNMILHGDGTMEIPDAQLSDTDTYRCIVHLPGNTKETHTHTVIVYTIAEYHMSYPFIYYVSECNYQLDNFKMHELHEFVCRDYERDCPFDAVSTCHKYQSSLNQMERSQLTVFIQQHPLEVYRPPSCDVLCIKKSIVEHFELMGAYIIRELYNKEESGQRKIYGNTVFSRDNSARLADVKARCQSGYERYQDIICMPCYPGHALKYTYSSEEELTPTLTTAHQRCEPCPANQFQDSFGMEECFYCPQSTYTSSNGSISPELCRKKGMAISWTVMILCGLLAAFLAAICCTWLIMACVSGTKFRKGSKTKEEEAVETGATSEFPPLNEQQPWIELLRQCEESSRSSPAGSPLPVTPSPVAPGVAAPSGPFAPVVEAPPGSVSLRSALKQRSTIDDTPIDSTLDPFSRSTGVFYQPQPEPQPPPPPPPPPIEYSSIYAVPDTPAIEPPTALQPIPTALATPRFIEGTSLATVRPALRPVVRQPVPLVGKASEANIYRRALISGLREVRIMPPGSGQSSAARMSSRSISAENWSQHSGGGGGGGGGGGNYPQVMVPSNASSNSKQVDLPVNSAHLNPTERPSSTSGLFRDQSGEQSVSGQQVYSDLLARQSRGLPVEIEVEFQRVPSATRNSRPPSSHAGVQPTSVDEQFEAADVEPQAEPQHLDRALSRHHAAQSAIEFQPQQQQRSQPMSSQQPRPFSRPSIHWTPQIDMDGRQNGQEEAESHHIRQQSSGSTQTSSEADSRTRRHRIVRRRHAHSQTSSESSQQSSEQTQSQETTPSQESSETRYTASHQSTSELEPSTVSRQSSESMDHRRSALAAHHRSSSGREEAAPQRRMRKALLDAINARSAPTHEDTNVYD